MDIDSETANVPADDEPASGGTACESCDMLRGELEAANARAEEHRNQHLYALADFENFKKRSERRFLDNAAAVKRNLLAKFLPVLDNLERALAYEIDSEGLRGGLEATQRGFEDLLASEGVKPIAVLGRSFDHNLAEAIGTRDVLETDDGIVLEEVQRGYMLGDDLLRPARVIVAKRVGDAEDNSERGA
jgi:molecular chaperone GrpE